MSMANARWTASMAAALLLGLTLGAQQVEPTTLGVQLRGDIPMGDLRDIVGGYVKPGLGGSVMLEEDFLDGYRGRLGLGADIWFKGKWLDKPGVNGGVNAFHLDVEAVRMLRTDADAPLVGPYVLAGVGFYTWAVSTEDTILNTKTTRQVSHLAATFGFGWRLNGHMDLEFKGLMGSIEPDIRAMVLSAAVTLRY
jgi:hypothetical protein